MAPDEKLDVSAPKSRLAEREGLSGDILRRWRQEVLPTPSEEAAAWHRLEETDPMTITGRTRLVRWTGLAGGAAVGVVALVLWARPDVMAPVAFDPGAANRRPTPRVGVMPFPELPSAAEPPATSTPGRRAPNSAPRVRLALSPRPVSIAAGESELADEATVQVTPEAVVEASATQRLVRVSLKRGAIDLQVTPRSPDKPVFEVAAGPYSFRVVGTAFRVTLDPAAESGSQVRLDVTEGKVAVMRGGRHLSSVVAGQRWTEGGRHPRGESAKGERASGSAGSRAAANKMAAAGGAPSSSSSAAAAAAAAPPADGQPVAGTALRRARCGELAAAGQPREAVACYLAQAEGDGVVAETALYETARLRRDALRDASGALDAFRAYRSRFPRGMLRAEADLSIVELLPKLNRHREALDEVGRLLAAGPGRERAAELRVLRGNIYREVLEDFSRAERDYAAAEEALRPLVGDATFFRGICLQALGKSDLARETYARYLAATPGRYREDAQRRLEILKR
jgi:TolA-binding protein